MKRLRKEGTAEELLQIVRISIPLSQNYTPEERTEATHFFANELMKLAREGKVIKPPILSPDFTKKQVLPQLAALEARHPGFSKLWKEGRLNDLPSHTAGERLRLIHLDWNAFVALKEWSECLADEPEREDERNISVESRLIKKLPHADPTVANSSGGDAVAAERPAAIRDSLSNEASDSAQKPEPRQPLAPSVTNGCDPLQAGSDATADRRVKAVFRKSGDLWEIGYEGKTLNFQDIKAFHFISRLLRERRKEILARELVAQVGPSSEGVANGANFTSEEAREDRVPIRDSLGAGGGGDVDDMIDGPALRQYRERLVANAKEREEAKENNDSARLLALNEEMEQINQEIDAATGHGGKIRKFAAPEDRARSNVTKQIKTAIEKISAQNPDLGSYLDRSIKTGMRCSYQPAPATDIHWKL